MRDHAKIELHSSELIEESLEEILRGMKKTFIRAEKLEKLLSIYFNFYLLKK